MTHTANVKLVFVCGIGWEHFPDSIGWMPIENYDKDIRESITHYKILTTHQFRYFQNVLLTRFN